MARISKANDNPITEEVVTLLNDKEAEKEAAKKAYQQETDDVVRVVRKAKIDKIHPDYNSLDTMVRLVAEVPQSVAVEAVRELKFKEKYPCLTAYAFGLVSGVVVMGASVLVGVML